MARPECVLEAKDWLGEGPCWHPREQALYWTDVCSKKIKRWHPGSGAQASWDMPEMVTAIAVCGKGGLIVASHTGIDFFDPANGRATRFCAPEKDKPKNRSNDGKCDRRGRFWYGTMMNNFAADMGEVPITGNTGGLYRIDPDGSVHSLEQGVGIANTFAWSPDDKTFYFADTFQGEIWKYDYDLATGTPANKRLFASFKNDPGVADGSTVDAEGCVWNAQLISGDLVRYEPDGSVERRIGMPVRNITSVVFGGDKLDEIYVTSMARVKHPAVHERFAKEAKPQFLAGSLFRITGLGIRGVPEPRFAG
jgi:L-arabinonolactonase